jgi:SutA RNAP-binding domain
MAQRKLYPPPPKTKSTMVLTSEMLAKQTEEYLKAGGSIQRIERGVSGYNKVTGGTGSWTSTKPTK